MTPSALLNAWGRINRWLAEHAPNSYLSLQTGATALDIREAELRLGTPFPAELVELLGMSDGSVNLVQIDDDEEGEIWAGQFLNGHHLLSLKAICHHHAHLAAHQDPRIASEKWIPFAATYPDDPTYSGMFIDSEGAVGRYGAFGGLDATPKMYASLSAYLAAVAEALEVGRGPAVTQHNVPAIALGALVWRDPVNPSPMNDVEWTPVHQ
ncbi:SMI1/KNR4 family protein [Spirillospora sp. CA-253888]